MPSAPIRLIVGLGNPGADYWLLQPTTFMNRSGQAVAALANFYKIAPDEILVIHDELDLPPGGIRLKQGGGNGGHNGLKDIQARLGTPDFWRLRLGIGHPGDRDRVAGYVLHDFARADRDWLDKLLDAVAKEVPDLLAGDEARFPSRVALALNPPRPRPPRPAPLAKEQD